MGKTRNIDVFNGRGGREKSRNLNWGRREKSRNQS